MVSDCADDADCSKSSKNRSFPKISLSQRIRRKNVNVKKPKRRLTCEKCKLKFATWWERRDHWTSTGHKVPEQCRWCQKKTFALQSHLCKQHWEACTICRFCGQLFMFREDHEKHQSFHTGTEYRCFQCGRRKKNEEHLRLHVLSHFIHEKYGCCTCEKRFKKKKNLDRHLIQVHCICQYCGQSFDDTSKLKKHRKSHSDLKCVFCQKVFSQLTRLKYHYQLKHSHQEFYKCSECSQRFTTKGKLQDHKKLKHNGIFNYSCEGCDAKFLYWKNYINHYETVHTTPDTKFSCSHCDFTTNNKSKLQWHIEKTSGSGFFCNKCQLRLECKGTFDQHMSSHEGEELEWKCDHCPKRYSSVDVLKHHMIVAHREHVMAQNPRGYPCSEPSCDKYYTNKNSLSRHMRTAHSGTSNTEPLCSTQIVACRTCVVGKGKKRPRKDRDLNKKTRRYKKSKKLIKSAKEESLQISEHLSDKSEDLTNIPDIMEVSAYCCASCDKLWFMNDSQFKIHMRSHEKETWKESCGDCNVDLESPVEAVRHYVERHLHVPFSLL